MPVLPEREANYRAAVMIRSDAARQAFRIGNTLAFNAIDAREWDSAVKAVLRHGTLACARLGLGAVSFSEGDLVDLEACFADAASAFDRAFKSLALFDNYENAAKLSARLTDTMVTAFARCERHAAKSAGASWERRIPGRSCPPSCQDDGKWAPIGQTKLPGTVEMCRCRQQFATGKNPPSSRSRVEFEVPSADELNDMTPWEIRELDPQDAAEALDQNEGDLDEDTADILEQVAEEAGFSNPNRSAKFSKPAKRRRTLGLAHILRTPDPEVLTTPATSDDPLYHPLVVHARDLVKQAKDKGVDTASVYADDDGVYDPDRSSLHNVMAQQMSGITPASGRPQAVLVVGDHGSDPYDHASELAKKVSDTFTTVDPVHIAQALPEYQGWNLQLLLREAGDVFHKVLDAAMAHGNQLLVRMPGASPQSASGVLSRLGGAGYDVHLLKTSVDPQVAANRAASGFMTNPFGLSEPLQPPAPLVDPDVPLSEAETADSVYDDLRDDPTVLSWLNCDVSDPSDPNIVDSGERAKA